MMKFVLLLLGVMFFVTSAVAQGVDERALEKKIRDAIETMPEEQWRKSVDGMKGCLDIDQQKLSQMAERGKRVMKQVKALCDKGERDKAEEIAKEQYRQGQSDPTLKKLENCSKGVMKELKKDPDFRSSKNGHVCDQSL